jgi:hypothetical protein
MIGTIHYALKINAVSQRKHVSSFMCQHFNTSAEQQFLMKMAARVSFLVGASKAIIKAAVKIIKPTTKIKDFMRPDMTICLLYYYSAFSVPDSW